MPRAQAQAQTDIEQTPIQLLEAAEGFRRQAEQSFGQYALEAGKLLLQAKRRIAHGQWAEHVQRYTGFSLRTAEVYMKARRRWDAMPARQRQEVLEQPFSRSLLVLAQAPRQTPPRPAQPQLPSSHTEPGANGTHTADAAENFLGLGPRRGENTPSGLDQTQLETTRLLNQAIDFQGAAPEVEEDEDVEHEPTPLDDILDQPRSLPRVGEAEGEGEEDEEFQRREQQALFEEALEANRELEARVRSLERELTETRQAAASGGGQPALRGYDYVSQLVQYLKADEPQRTPESLARRAVTLPDGRATISYLEQFFAACRQHLQLLPDPR